MSRIILQNGRILDPSQDVLDGSRIGDLWLKDGIILGCRLHGPEEIVSGDIPDKTDDEWQMIDCSGKYIVPGLIDIHVHLREPGYEYKEDIASGTRAAARGGFTAVACMPNTNPAADNSSVIQFIRMRAQQNGKCRVYPIGALTKGQAGSEMTEIADLKDAGAVALSDDGQPVSNAEIMRRALEYAKMFDLPVLVHEEDKQLVGDGVMNEGYHSLIYGMKGIPAAAEDVMIARDICLCELTGSRLHFCHVSTSGGVRMIRDAKRRGLPVTAETTPHHLALTDGMLGTYDTSFKVNPPLRTAADTEALAEGLADGTLDVIVTDHAPHSVEDKDCEFAYAPNGMIGLETSFAVVYQELVMKNKLTLSQLIDKMSCSPARILHLPGGTLQAGAPADVTVLDLERSEIVTRENLASKSCNTPFLGREIKGLPVMTIVGGRIVMADRKITED